MNALIFLATGFEEAEFTIPYDIFKRAGIETDVVSIDENRNIRSSHQLTVVADKTACEISDDYDIVFLPGGMPGAINLQQSWLVCQRLIKMCNENKIISAICASPSAVLAPLGLLDGKKATCYPGCESLSEKKDFLSDGVVVDGNIITAKSAGWAFEFALKIVELALGKEKAEETRKAVYYLI